MSTLKIDWLHEQMPKDLHPDKNIEHRLRELVIHRDTYKRLYEFKCKQQMDIIKVLMPDPNPSSSEQGTDLPQQTQ